MMFPKPKSWRSATYRQWVRSLRCLIPGCWSREIEAAHASVKGKGLKHDDFYCVPICRMHHSEQHALGILSFQSKYNIDLKVEAETLWQRSPWCSEIRDWMKEDRVVRLEELR